MHRNSTDFSKRLGHYGISQVGHDHIHITSPIVWDEDHCPFNVTTIKTGDLDELKRLFGVPDSSLVNVEPHAQHKHLASLSKLSSTDAYEAASAYIYGNSSLLKHHKEAIENVLGEREVKVASAKTMTVSSKMVVTGTNAIVVDLLIFEPGGQIVNMGVLTLNAAQIQNKTA